MKYTNPKVPHEVNDSTHEEGHVKDFSKNVLILGGLSIVLFFLAIFAGEVMARLLPYSWEKSWFGPDQVEAERLLGNEELNKLRDITTKVVAAMDLPDEMDIHIDVLMDKHINAYALPGGRIFLSDSLLFEMESENAIAFVIAHEIAHIKHRDGLKKMTGGLIIATAYNLVTGDLPIFGDQGFLVDLGLLSYNRHQEASADEAAIEAVAEVYGHVGDADALFKMLQKKFPERDDNSMMMQYMSSHPLDAERIEAIREYAEEHGYHAEGFLAPFEW